MWSYNNANLITVISLTSCNYSVISDAEQRASLADKSRSQRDRVVAARTTGPVINPSTAHAASSILDLSRTWKRRRGTGDPGGTKPWTNDHTRTTCRLPW